MDYNCVSRETVIHHRDVMHEVTDTRPDGTILIHGASGDPDDVNCPTCQRILKGVTQ